MLKGVLAALLFSASFVSPACAEDFAYHPPGKLQPSPTGKLPGSGDVSNRTIYAPNIRLPIELNDGEGIYPNSQVYRPGGMNGGNGSVQCDHSNYAMPWADVFCENRSRETKLCPGAKGHQGVDIRPPACKDKIYFAVAVEDGTISGINPRTSSITLTGRTGTTYLYLHLDPPSFLVKHDSKVKAGDRLGKVSNLMNGGHDTTVHLHFEIKQTVSYKGKIVPATNVPPYTSLIQANRQRLGLPNLNNNGVLDRDPVREMNN